MSKVVSTALASSPGIQRDGTVLAAQACLDGAWVRFYGGAPRKIGGWGSVVSASRIAAWDHLPLPAPRIMSLYQYPWLDGLTWLFVMGDWGYIAPGNPAPEYPAVLVPARLQGHAVQGWGEQTTPVQFPASFPWTGFYSCSSAMYAEVSQQYPDPVFLLCPVNARFSSDGRELPPDIACPAVQNVFWMPVQPSAHQMAQAQAIVDPNMQEEVTVAGGVCVIPPNYIFLYGSNGLVLANNPLAPDPVNTFSMPVSPGSDIFMWNDFCIASTKIVQGMPVLGSGMSAYFWSLNSVVLCQIQPDNLPSFRTVCEDISILSAQSVVNINNTFYWIGRDTFYALTGNVQEIHNTFNKLWFFEELNQDYAACVFGVANRMFHEIWWFFPRGTSTVCNWALVYNYQSNFWYDTGLPGETEEGQPSFFPGGVTCGLNNIFGQAPLVAGQAIQPGDSASHVSATVCQMEYGWDYQDAAGKLWPIPARVTTSLTGLYNQNMALTESWIHAKRLEMDLRMQGTLDLELMTCHFPADWLVGKVIQPFVQREPDQEGAEQYSVTAETRYVDFTLQGRLMTVRLRQNCAGGMFHIGQMILDWQTGSGNSGKKTVS